MTALDRTLPTPRLLEVESIDVALPCDRAWEIVRHGDLARSKLVRALFALRTLPSRLVGQQEGPLRSASMIFVPRSSARVSKFWLTSLPASW
jgi:hypothetical protein